MDCSMSGFPVHHQLLELTKTHVDWVGDAIQPSHPLSSPSPPAFNLSQDQGLFQWVSSSHQVTKVLEFQLQHQSFQDWFPSGLTGWISLQSKGLSRVFSNTTVQKHQFGTRWWKSRWAWSTSLSTHTSGIHLQTQKCMQNTSWEQTGGPDQQKRLYRAT